MDNARAPKHNTVVLIVGGRRRAFGEDVWYRSMNFDTDPIWPWWANGNGMWMFGIEVYLLFLFAPMAYKARQ